MGPPPPPTRCQERTHPWTWPSVPWGAQSLLDAVWVRPCAFCCQDPGWGWGDAKKTTTGAVLC